MQKSGKGISEGIVKLSSRILFKPKEDYSKIHTFQRDELIPSNKILYDMENESYEKKAKDIVDSWKLIAESETLKFYLKNNVIIIAIRGTASGSDILADIMAVAGKVESSKRYKDDEKFIKSVQNQYDPNKYYYFGVAHSLGGMIADILLHKNYIKTAVSYNPAVESKYMGNDNNYRIYSSKDEILYTLMGKYASNTEVRKETKKKDVIHKILKFTVGAPLTAIKLHLLSTPTLQGGKVIYKHQILFH